MNDLSVILDVEASALDGGFPIEIGFAFRDTAARGAQAESRLICHEPWLRNGKWCEEAERLHGITKERLRDEGRPLAEVCTWLNDSIGPQKAHVGDMRDKMWLSQAFDTVGRIHIFQLDYIGSFMRAAAISQTLYFQCLGDLRHQAAEDALQMTRALTRCLGYASNDLRR